MMFSLTHTHVVFHSGNQRHDSLAWEAADSSERDWSFSMRLSQSIFQSSSTSPGFAYLQGFAILYVTTKGAVILTQVSRIKIGSCLSADLVTEESSRKRCTTVVFFFFQNRCNHLCSWEKCRSVCLVFSLSPCCDITISPFLSSMAYRIRVFTAPPAQTSLANVH